MLLNKQWVYTLAIGTVALFAITLSNNSNSEAEVSGTLDKSAWKLFKPNNDRFEVLFPAAPQHVSEAHPNGKEVTKYDVFLSQDVAGNVFMISITQYPPSYAMGQVDDVLQAVKNGAVGSNSKNELKQVERSTFLNLPALDFTIANADSTIRSKVILEDKTLFVLTVMDKDPARLESDFNTFVGSFVIKHP